MFDGNNAQYPNYFNGYNFHYFGWTNTQHRMSRGWGTNAEWLTELVPGVATAGNYYTMESKWYGQVSDDNEDERIPVLKGYVNGVEKLSATNADYTSRSYMGFNSWGEGVWLIDRVMIRKCQAEEPTAELTATFQRPAVSNPTPAPQTTSFVYDDYNKLTGITYPDSATETLTYNDNGQLIRSEKSTGEVTAYEWNDQGMLKKVILPTGEPVEYYYDGNQRLVSRKSSDGVDKFVQSGWDIMTKMDDVGKRTYYTGSSAVEDKDSVKYFHYNHRGDTVLVTDSEGNLLNNFTYEAYGKATNNEGIPITKLTLKNSTTMPNLPNLFVGASGIRYDTKTNLHYMRFRWFSPEQMRFISPDLLMTLNRYAYVSGNPIIRIDPAGLFDRGFINADERTRLIRRKLKYNGPGVWESTFIYLGKKVNVAQHFWEDVYKDWETWGPYGSRKPEYWALGWKQLNPYYWNDLILVNNEMGIAPGIDISTPWGGVVFARYNYRTDVFIYPNCKFTNIFAKPSVTFNIIQIFNYSKEKNKGWFSAGNISKGGLNFTLFGGQNLKKDPCGWGIGLTLGGDSGLSGDLNIQYFLTPEDIQGAIKHAIKYMRYKYYEYIRTFVPTEDEFFNNFGL